MNRALEFINSSKKSCFWSLFLKVFNVMLFYFLSLNSVSSQAWDSIQTPGNIYTYHHFISKENGWICTYEYFNGNYYKLFKTADGGANWVEVIVPILYLSNRHITGMYLFDSHNCIITCYYFNNQMQKTHCIISTANGGNTWDDLYCGGTSSIRLPEWPEQNSIFAISGYSTMHKSLDGGNSWSIFPTPNIICNSLFYFNIDTFVITGIDVLDDYSYFAKTTNGGNTWLKTEFPDLYYANSIFFINPNVGWICGRLGKIKKTTDGGNTWFDCYAGVDDWLQDIVFYDENNGWLVTDKGRIMRTYNGGQNWVTEFQSDTSLNTISLTADGYLFASGCNGKIYKSAVNLSNILESHKHFHVYPNPASTTLTVITGIQNQTESIIELYDMRGKRVLATTTRQSETTVNVSFLPAGVYSCTVSNDKYWETVKVVKL